MYPKEKKTVIYSNVKDGRTASAVSSNGSAGLVVNCTISTETINETINGSVHTGQLTTTRADKTAGEIIDVIESGGVVYFKIPATGDVYTMEICIAFADTSSIEGAGYEFYLSHRNEAFFTTDINSYPEIQEFVQNNEEERVE